MLETENKISDSPAAAGLYSTGSFHWLRQCERVRVRDIPWPHFQRLLRANHVTALRFAIPQPPSSVPASDVDASEEKHRFSFARSATQSLAPGFERSHLVADYFLQSEVMSP